MPCLYAKMCSRRLYNDLRIDHFWLLVAVSGLVASTVSSQSQADFANPPPLPTKGVGLFLGIHNTTLSNYAMIAARDFGDRDGGSVSPDFTGHLDGLNDGLWCQSANGSQIIGYWKFPDGSDVPGDLNAEPIHMAHRPGQVGLLRSAGINNSPYQGMYTCTIPDENGVTQTLVVWASGNGPYDAVPNPVVAEVLFIPSSEPQNTNPPELILSIDVRVAPPTHVTCQVDSTPVEISVLSREVTAGEYFPFSTASPVTNVNVTLRTRQAGNYTCNVSVYRASGDNLSGTTSPISISVTGTPTALSAMQVGPNTIHLSWSHPASNTPPVAGYEVFYVMSGSYSVQSGGSTTNTAINLTLSKVGITYIFFVVAFSDALNTLPSAHSNTINIELETIYSTPPGDLVTSDSTTPTATPNTPALDVTATTSEDSDSSANCGSVIGAFSGVLVISVMVNVMLGIMLLVSLRHGGFLLKNANGSQSLASATLNFSKFPWNKKNNCGVRKNEQLHIPSEATKKTRTGVETPGNVPSDSHDLYHTLEGDHTYSNVDNMEQEVVVLSSNPAYSKHDHTYMYPNLELNRRWESGQGAGGGRVVMKTAKAK